MHGVEEAVVGSVERRCLSGCGRSGETAPNVDNCASSGRMSLAAPGEYDCKLALSVLER